MTANDFPFAARESYRQHSKVISSVLNQLQPGLFKHDDLINSIQLFIFQDIAADNKAKFHWSLQELRQAIRNQMGIEEISEEALGNLLDSIEGMRLSIAQNKLNAPDQLNNFLYHPQPNLFVQLKSWSERFISPASHNPS